MINLPAARERIGRYRGALFHLAGGLTVLLAWRFMSLPSPDSLGLLIPLAWLLTGLIQGEGGIPRHSAVLLSAFLLFSVFWTAGPVPELLARASALSGAVPGLFASARRRSHGYLLALVPLLPIIVLRVPFVHDEPFYSTMTEQMVAPGAGVFGNMDIMYGDASEVVRHHQPLYPALLLPGYWLGETGVRLVNVVMALFAAMLLASLLRREGMRDWRLLVLTGFLTVPGIGTLGIVYPEWLAIAVFCGCAMQIDGRRGLFWAFITTLLLAVMKERFSLLGIGLILAWLSGKPRRTRHLVLLLGLGLTVAILLLDLFAFSGRVFIVRYVNMPALKGLFSSLILRMPATLFNTLSSLVDVEGGLLWKAPWIIAALAGLPALRRTHAHTFRLLAFPAITYAIGFFLWKSFDWQGFPTPCGRMLTPILPLLLASLSGSLGSRQTRMLIALSLGVSVLHVVSPGLRFNDADGTDILFSSLMGSESRVTALLPSWIRPALIPYLAWSVMTAILIMLAAKGRKGLEALLLASAVILGSIGESPATAWEAEDLPGEYVDHCRLYPDMDDPMLRRYWLGSQELMLEMMDPSDAIRLPVPEGLGDTIMVGMSCRTNPAIDKMAGVLVRCGAAADSTTLRSGIMETPAWFEFMTGGELRPKPEYATELQVELSLPDPGPASWVVITPIGAGFYLDRVEIR